MIDVDWAYDFDADFYEELEHDIWTEVVRTLNGQFSRSVHHDANMAANIVRIVKDHISPALTAILSDDSVEPDERVDDE